MKKLRKIGIIVTAFVSILGGTGALTQANVLAIDHTVSPGQSIQAALKAAAPGDTVILNAGTYNERLEIVKPVTLKGNGTVVINTKDSTNINLADMSVYQTSEAFKGVAIYDTSNVTIQNITFDGENDSTPTQTGIDISGTVNTTLTNVTAKNYMKNGIAVTTQFDATRPTGSGVALNNVTVDNADWAGIAFYPKSNGDGVSPGIEVALKGVTFSGTTAISNTSYGIQFGDSATTEPIEGISGGPVALGTVVFAGNGANISQDVPGIAAITLANDSTINGLAVTAADFAGLSVTLVASLAGGESAVIPGVPNTSVAL